MEKTTKTEKKEKNAVWYLHPVKELRNLQLSYPGRQTVWKNTGIVAASMAAVTCCIVAIDSICLWVH